MSTSENRESFNLAKVSRYTVIGEREKRARHSQVCTIENHIMVRAISVYSAGVPYATRFTTAAVKLPLPLATFQF